MSSFVKGERGRETERDGEEERKRARWVVTWRGEGGDGRRRGGME